MDFDLENPLTDFHALCSDSATSLFHIESDHMLSENYIFNLQARNFNICVRREVITSISKFSCGFGPLVSYLAVNYLDRFLSSHGLLKPKQWVLKLLAISCVSIAAKMKKTEFSMSDFQVESGIIFDIQTIRRMEILILGALEWRMRSITPLSFISFFISLFKLEDPQFQQALKSRATEIIFKAQNVKFMLFKPSIISAAALLSASHELFPMQFQCFEKALFNCSDVNKENLLKCYNAMEATLLEGDESVLESGFSSCVTPVNVLDQHFSISESEKTNGNVISTLPLERDIKRRKITDYCNNQTVQVSQI